MLDKWVLYGSGFSGTLGYSNLFDLEVLMDDKYKKRNRAKNALCWFFIVVVIVIIVLSLYFNAAAEDKKEHYLPIVVDINGPTPAPTACPGYFDKGYCEPTPTPHTICLPHPCWWPTPTPGE